MSEEHNDNLHKGAIGKLYQYGREFRQSSTKAEKILWEYLRDRKLEGLKFRRTGWIRNQSYSVLE